MTQLEFFKKAKTHFSKKRNKVGMVSSGGYKKALCSFLKNCDGVGDDNFDRIKTKIAKAVQNTLEKHWQKDPDSFMKNSTVYFYNDKDRMDFIDSQIKRLTKK